MPAFEKQTIANPRPTQTKEAQAPIPISVQEPEIQLAFFHHRFSWAPPPPECPYQSHMGNSDGTQMYADSLPAAVGDNALDFEKRAPFPTINLLRARTVKMYANEVNHPTLHIHPSRSCDCERSTHRFSRSGRDQENCNE